MENLTPLILAIGVVITSITGLLAVIQQWRMSAKLKKIETHGNSAQEQLLALTKAAGIQEGIKQQKQNPK